MFSATQAAGQADGEERRGARLGDHRFEPINFFGRREHAEQSGMFYVNQRWLGGTLTNFGTVRKSVRPSRLLSVRRKGSIVELQLGWWLRFWCWQGLLDIVLAST